MRIKALITLAVSATKEIPVGRECDLNDADAKHLIELGFAQPVKSAKTQTPQPANSNKKPEDEPKTPETQGGQDDTSTGQGGE